MAVPEDDDIERFYQTLLAIDQRAEPTQWVDEALRLVVEITRARLSYLEVVGDQPSSRFSRSFAISDSNVTSTPPAISRGIVDTALREDSTIETTSALHDLRFTELTSVRQNAIGAVLCAPVRFRAPIGVLYLQSARSFSRLDRRRVELMAQQIARNAQRLLPRAQPSRSLPQEVRELQNRRIREALERHDGNIAEVARELGIGRAFVYSVKRRQS